MNKVSHEFLKSQEDKLVFDKFSSEDALALGLEIIDTAKKNNFPIAIEITVNHLVIFRFFSERSIRDNELWLTRKRNTVNLMSMSSLRFKYWLENKGQTLEDRQLSSQDFATVGGGFPIVIKSTGNIGSICVSGPPNHFDDHQIIVDALKNFLK